MSETATLERTDQGAGVETETAPCRLVVLDIETGPTTSKSALERLTQEALEKKPAYNTAKALKIKWNTSESRAERVADALAKTALDPLLARVVVVGILSIEQGEEVDHGHGSVVTLDTRDVSGLAEARDLLDALMGDETILVGHNISGFDLPVLTNAWRREGIAPPDAWPTWTGSWWSGRVFDTMVRTPAKTPYTSLVAACAAFGVVEEEPVLFEGEPMEGSRVGAALQAGAIETIRCYCATDVLATWRLYQALTVADTWGTWPRIEDDLRARVREIATSPALTDSQKGHAIVAALGRAGWL